MLTLVEFDKDVCSSYEPGMSVFYSRLLSFLVNINTHSKTTNQDRQTSDKPDLSRCSVWVTQKQLELLLSYPMGTAYKAQNKSIRHQRGNKISTGHELPVRFHVRNPTPM